MTPCREVSKSNSRFSKPFITVRAFPSHTIDCLQTCELYFQFRAALSLAPFFPLYLVSPDERWILNAPLPLCFKSRGSRGAVMSSTVASTLQQMVMFIVDDVVEEDRRLLASELGSTIPQNRMSRSLNPASHDICVIIQYLCLLQNGERTQILQLEHHNTFAL